MELYMYIIDGDKKFDAIRGVTLAGSAEQAMERVYAVYRNITDKEHITINDTMTMYGPNKSFVLETYSPYMVETNSLFVFKLIPKDC